MRIVVLFAVLFFCAGCSVAAKPDAEPALATTKVKGSVTQSQASVPEKYQGLDSEELVRVLGEEYRPSQVLNYRKAREKLFDELRRKDGRLKLVYTTDTFKAGRIPNHKKVNTEHTWPKSKFGRDKMVKSDLHHLYPTRSKVNAERSSNPFAEIPDEKTERWWKSPVSQRDVPTEQRDDYSESTSRKFEPPENHKGDVARAMFYVYTVYQDKRLDLGWFRPQVSTLLDWHEQDPVDEEERLRDLGITEIQGNHNPYILYPGLATTVFAPLK